MVATNRWWFAEASLPLQSIAPWLVAEPFKQFGSIHSQADYAMFEGQVVDVVEEASWLF